MSRPSSLQAEEQIHITSQQLISDTEKNQAEFIGNVVVVQGKTRITANRLKIFFAKGAGGKKNAPDQSITKLLATGNVNIKFDNRVAVAQEALYITETEVLTLTGPNATVTSDNNTISGDTITFYRRDGRFTVQGKTGSPVRALLLPQDSKDQGKESGSD
ncbi:lipopolysaccharide transport periplasmic protein LptA [Desulfosarcina sp. OttesenSCG-928-A07]|nr:lipopolysaccharide transport periplasmic protein LptA [Desulfosarcina sp. OttesenSCG-928-G17]MDL2329540.1 lipopolysaccharide transport periplasmic protein LptA [Desulfosarcina sp. OttesenSCG-928-A07]